MKTIHLEELCEIKQSLKVREGKQRQEITSTQMISKATAKNIYTHTHKVHGTTTHHGLDISQANSQSVTETKGNEI